MKSIIHKYLILTIGLVLASCAPSGSVTVPTRTETLFPSPTFSKPTSSPPPTLTRTPLATKTPTLTPLPTLEPKQVQEAISKLLQTAEDCEAPCFWGIVPGETTIDEAASIFTHYGLQSRRITEGGRDFYGINYDFTSGLSVTVTLTVQKKLVKNLTVDILPKKQTAGVHQEWLAYSPETLINRYGPPSRVAFALDWGPRFFLEMDLYFDDIDLIVRYVGHDIIPRQKGPARVCPLTAQFESVRFWMGEHPVNPPLEAKPLEIATSMTIEEFASLMTGDRNKACFIVKGDTFP